MDNFTVRGTFRYKRALLSGALLLCLIGVISLALVYKSRAATLPPGTDSHSDGNYNDMYQKDAGRQAVIRWMGENSAMSESVLSDIYGIAASTVHTDLVLAICLVESNYNPRAVSNKGAMGLMGIMPGVWLDELKAQGILGKKEDLYKISNNIAAGSYVLERYISKTRDIRHALIRYEGGDSWYATRVLKAMRKISLMRHSRKDFYIASARD